MQPTDYVVRFARGFATLSFFGRVRIRVFGVSRHTRVDALVEGSASARAGWYFNG